VARRADPVRIDEARAAATRNRLMGEGMTEAMADAWIAAWAERARTEGIERGATWWDRGYAWIAAEREHRPRP
jgi:hypothetical protein